MQQHRMPKDKLEHERRIANDLNIATHQAAQQRVRRKPRKAQQNTKHGAQRDADNGDTQRIQQPNRQRPAISIGRRIGD